MKINKLINLMILVFILLFFSSYSFAASTVQVCSESNCSAITVTFGGQIHPITLNCDNILSFLNVPAGTYAWRATGCGVQWSGNATVDGVQTYRISLCPNGLLPCCAIGCGDSGVFICSDCTTTSCPAEMLIADDNDLLSILRDFNKGVLKHSLSGTALSDMYYGHTNELKMILNQNEALADRVKQLISNIIPLFDLCAQGTLDHVDANLISETIDILSEFETRGSDYLVNDIQKLKKDILSGQLTNSICR